MSKYMITDGRNYLRRDAQGNFVPVSNKLVGDVFDQRYKASNVLKNCVNHNLRKRYHVIEVKDAQKVTGDIIVAPKEDVAKSIADEQIETSLLEKWEKDIGLLMDFVQTTEERKEELCKALSDVDLEISDINHYIELGKHNAYEGWIAFNMLRTRLKKRRVIKDELQILQQLGECKVNSSMIEGIKDSIGSLSAREYKPRRLMDLFD